MDQLKAPIILDFETDGIQRRPKYPPVPRSFAVQEPGKPYEFWSWGHPSENGRYIQKRSLLQKIGDCSQEQAYRRIVDLHKQACRQSGSPLLYQNGKFDVDVAETHCGAPRMPWEKMHDTMFLIALDDPHAATFSLKPSAHRILGMKPEEQDAVKAWILTHVPEAKRKPSEWGAYICRAPGALVGKYAVGDIVRTGKLFDLLHERVCDDKAPKGQQTMLDAYERERELMPILLDTERVGLQVDLDAMEEDYADYCNQLQIADAWLRIALKAPSLNLDADRDVGDALDKHGVVTNWVMTKKGFKSVAKKNMTLDMFNNQQIAQVYGYRQRLATCISMFFEPWLGMARESNGIIYTNWNQVRQSRDKSNVGARTGRLSSNPNLQNIPTDFTGKGDGYTGPITPLQFKLSRSNSFTHVLRPLPFMRKYIVSGKGRTWIKRDYSQQEIRILAHYEEGYLLEKYNNDPGYDLHADVKGAIKEFAGLDLPRGQVKILNFGDIYGMGFTSFHEKTRVGKEEYDRIKAAKKQLLPDLAELDSDIKRRGKEGLPIRTWGGRLYYCEPPMFVKKFGREMTFEYKLLNYLIQGSAADCTKQAVINFVKHPHRTAQFLLTVHDEINAVADKKDWKDQMGVLRDSMLDVNFAVAMKSDGGHGPNWHDLKDAD
jgi:DNA polymerase I-like protein with 3'-5' exonuclease and polymerase domains